MRRASVSIICSSCRFCSSAGGSTQIVIRGNLQHARQWSTTAMLTAAFVFMSTNNITARIGVVDFRVV